MNENRFKQKAVATLKSLGAKLPLASFTNNSLLIILSLVIAFLMTFHFDYLPKDSAVGSVAVQDVKADRNYEVIDEKATDKLRRESVSGIRPVYDFDSTQAQSVVQRVREAFDFARLSLAESYSLETGRNNLSVDQEAKLKEDFVGRLDFNLSDSQYDMIRRSRFSTVMCEALNAMLREVMSQPIIHERSELVPFLEKGFVLRHLSLQPPYSEELMEKVDSISELKEAQGRIANRPLTGAFKPEDAEALKGIAVALTRVNVHYNSIETEERQQRAKASVSPSIIKIKRGESIIRSGDRFEAWHLVVLEGIRKSKKESNEYLKFLGVFIFVNVVLITLYAYSFRYIRRFQPSRKDLMFMGVMLVLFLSMLRFGVFLSSPIRDALPFAIGISTFYYCIPIAAGAMLIRFILNAEAALVFAVVSSIFSGVFLENSLELAVFYLVSSVFAAHAIANVNRRSSVLLAGIYTGLINALTIFSLHMISLVSFEGSLGLDHAAMNAAWGFFGGLFTSMVVLALTPVCEVLFNYTTDVTLLELANMSHPLLKQMIVQSPGTYHHSQLVGVLSEGGAEAIGANALLARVASYYHDIGKMKKPQYFIENQRDMKNPHDDLSPSMSALIIAAHVKDGIEMAKEHKLPKRIADMIPEHQGTKLIGYFYNKAKKMENPDMGGRVDEKDYRYPGPKPQSREAGVIMLADTVEAAVRSLPEKSPSKIQTTVEKIVNQHFVDEQLDECDLTLRDLHQIAGSFVKILLGIYHHRVEYPEGTFQKHDSSLQQPAPEPSNIAQLFRKKHP